MRMTDDHYIRARGADFAVPGRGILFQVSEEWIKRSRVAEMESRSAQGSVRAQWEQSQVLFLFFREYE